MAMVKEQEFSEIRKNSEISESKQLFRIGDTVKISDEGKIATVINISNAVLCKDPKTGREYVSTKFHYGLAMPEGGWRHGFENNRLELVKRKKRKKEDIPKYKIGNLVKLTKGDKKGIIGKISSITRMPSGNFVYHIYDVDGWFSDDEAKRINIIQRLLIAL